MTDLDRLLAATASLVVRAGVNLAPGQELLVHGQVEHAPLIRAIAAEAYRSGARHVDVGYTDPYIRRALAEHGPDDALDWTPPWAVARMERARAEGAAAILITSGGQASAFEGVDERRLARAQPLAWRRSWLDGVMRRELAWTIIPAATQAWARELFGAPDTDRLWGVLEQVLRLGEPDPVAAWAQRFDELEQRAQSLTDRRFTAIRYRGPGTDLEVGLIEGARWTGGRDRTIRGQVHAGNIPTEEVFTTPHRLRAEGTVRASLPLLLRGTLVEGIELRLSGGRVVEARATRGEDALRADLALDEGASHLGELALVDATSGVGRAGLVFRETLLDENAASHIAWGSGLSWVLPDLPAAEAQERGINDSGTHTDFMVGCPELEIDGVEPGGAAVPILRGGEWQLPA